MRRRFCRSNYIFYYFFSQNNVTIMFFFLFQQQCPSISVIVIWRTTLWLCIEWQLGKILANVILCYLFNEINCVQLAFDMKLLHPWGLQYGNFLVPLIWEFVSLLPLLFRNELSMTLGIREYIGSIHKTSEVEKINISKGLIFMYNSD